MPTYSQFSRDAVERAHAAARSHGEALQKLSTDTLQPAGVVALSLAAECVTASVEDGKVCVELPLGLGKHCLPITIPLPVDAKVEVCLDICYTWHIPTGVKVTVSFQGRILVTQTFGKC